MTAGGSEWTEPGCFEVAPGVHRMPLPLPNDGLRAVNVYALVEGDDLVLVDGGWAVPDAREALVASLGLLGCGLGDIRRFLVTHLHRDHYSQAIAVRRELGTRVSLGIGEKPSLEELRRADRAPLEPRLAQLRAYGAAELVDKLVAAVGAAPVDYSQWDPPDDWLREAEVGLAGGRRLEVIETPGHTRGHVVFADRASGICFAGDHVLPTITPSIGFEPVMSPDPLGDFLGSLAKLRAMPDARLLPAHGPVAPSVHARIDELVEHHGRRLDRIEAAVAAGADTVHEVAGTLRWTRRERQLADLDLFNQMLAVAETGAHLTLLVAQGRATRHDDEAGVHHYRTA